MRVAPSLPADWLATEYPAATDLAASARGGRPVGRAATLAAGGAGPRSVAQTDDSGGRQNPGIDAAARTAERPQEVRRDHARLEAEEKSLEKSLSAPAVGAEGVRGGVERLTREREHRAVRPGPLRRRAETAGVSEAGGAEDPGPDALALARVVAGGGGEGRYERPVRLERREDAAGGGGRPTSAAGSCSRPRVNRDVLQRNLEEMERQAEAFPAEARQEPAALAAALAAARAMDRACEEELRKAHSFKDKLDHDREERQKIEEECREKDGELTVQKALAELLGKDRLQLYLVRQAERQVVEHANAVLDRLSGGQLYLKLSGEAEGDGSRREGAGVGGVQPRDRREADQRRLPVGQPEVSGGRESGAGHRPVRQPPAPADRVGHHRRGVRLSGPPRPSSDDPGTAEPARPDACILLVSHQEEFADAFSDGYHFELEAGATRVKRFQK